MTNKKTNSANATLKEHLEIVRHIVADGDGYGSTGEIIGHSKIGKRIAIPIEFYDEADKKDQLKLATKLFTIHKIIRYSVINYEEIFIDPAYSSDNIEREMKKLGITDRRNLGHIWVGSPEEIAERKKKRTDYKKRNWNKHEHLEMEKI